MGNTAKKRATRNVPQRIGKYEIVREVGEGSTGTVYLSHDPYYGRDVAIKLYYDDFGGDEDKSRAARKMFLSEAHMVGMLQHPQLMPIYDAGEENGHCYVVTEYVHGARTLAAFCRQDDLLRVDQVVEIIFKCAKALHYAHSRGVIHRDIKPSNIMYTQDGDVRIIDFGIALVSDSDMSHLEGIAGSPSYMSPEQAQGQPLTNRSDIYSLGAVMYELLTGSRPFRAGNLAKLMHQIIYATPPPIHTLRREVPEDLEEVVATALQKDPDKRYKSGQDLAAALTRVHQKLRTRPLQIEHGEQLGLLRKLKFFHEFSPAEIAEVLKASSWQNCSPEEEIVREGDMEDRFYIVVAGNCAVERHGRMVGQLTTGDCFGESSYVPGARRSATVRATSSVTLLRVGSTLLEQASASCQLRFNKVFLRGLIERLQGAETDGSDRQQPANAATTR
ncbi:MAG TPA: serine/threonine-protein kinase [Steroidobacteraceae bacterium]|nr:serine/threonine-protein kinase [Steroidobacteraceae bacterium]